MSEAAEDDDGGGENGMTLTNGIDNLGTWCVFSTTRPLTAGLADGLQLEVRPTADGCAFDTGLEITVTDVRSPSSGILSTTTPLASLGESAEDMAARISEDATPARVDAATVRDRFVKALTGLAEATSPDGAMVSLDDRGVDIYEATESVTSDPETGGVTVEFRHDDGNTYPQTYTASQWDHSQHDVAREEKDPMYEAARVPPISAREKYTDPHVICRPEDAHRWQTLKKLWARMATAEDAGGQ